MRPNRFTALFSLLVLLLLVQPLHLFAQKASLANQDLTNVRIDALSDDEIKGYYQKAVNAGFSQDQVIKMATDRGLPLEEVGKLKSRLASLSSGIRPAEKNTTDTIKRNTRSGIDREIDDDAMEVPKQRIKRDTTIFGSELFMESSQVFEPNLRIPSPGNYILGPDDQLQVSVFGYSEQSYSLTVNAEGNVYIPNVGPIKVVGLTLEEASDRIKTKLANTIYRAIKSGQTKVEVSLGKIRSIRVTVIGQAFKPGTYTVSSFTTLFNLLYICGGPSDMGSYRNIEVIRGNKIIRNVDLYAFLMQGNRSDNLLLEEQDVVRIPYYSIRAKMEGYVKRAGKFELKTNENFDQLLNYSGGFSDSAFRGSVQVTRMGDNGLTLFSLKPADFGAFVPASGDAFNIGKALGRYNNRVTVMGAVMRPGDYELKPEMGVKELIELAGGLREDAFSERAVISRVNDNLTPGTVSFQVKNVLDGSEKVALKKEDLVRISSIFDLKDQQSISIEGEVRSPGNFTYSDKITLNDLILKAGGFKESANKTNIEIARRIKNPDVSQKDYRQTETITVDISKGLGSTGSEIELEPFDAVVVRSAADYTQPRWVYVSGPVMNAGRYVLEASGERLSHLLQRVGGFKGSADSNSLIVKRTINSNVPLEDRQKIIQRLLNIEQDSLDANQKLRETYLKDVELLGVNLNKVRSTPNGREDLILEDGDIITISRASNLVRIRGEVRNPTLMAYDEGSSARYYIKRTGGFTDNARKSGVFVLYPDGRAVPVKRFLWFKNYPAVTPRSEVFIPTKSKENRKSFGTGEWIAFSSIIASLGTMVVALISATK